jgi:hypothetical protein
MAVQQCHVLVLLQHWMVVGSRWLPTVPDDVMQANLNPHRTTRFPPPRFPHSEGHAASYPTDKTGH